MARAVFCASYITVQACLFFSAVSGLNIILNNDDSFASVQIRELYRVLNDAGHNAWIVAPVYGQSGVGGHLEFTTSANLTSPGEFGAVPKGAPSYGTDPNDPRIWYYDGSPSACTFFALDYVVPNFWNGSAPDLFVTGPNFGTNPGPFMFTLSGTLAAAYSAIQRGYPAVAFSAASYGPARGYQDLVQQTKTGFPDPATIIANLSTQLVDQLTQNASSGRLLPEGYGITVNFPAITSLSSKECLDPPFITSRLTGTAWTTKAVFDPNTGLFSAANTVPANGTGLNACINGNCSLPSESSVVDGCQSSVSIFTVDYDAPLGTARDGIELVLGALVTDEQSAVNYSSTTAVAPSGTVSARSTETSHSAGVASKGASLRTSVAVFGLSLAAQWLC